MIQHTRHFSQALDFVGATCTQDQGLEKNGKGIVNHHPFIKEIQAEQEQNWILP
ncbi:MULTISPECIES: hypothetical protein [unclassified Leptolyngbya]|uniref:hypothetical protein n=1 Tax=unclassified Leptolyngbya TaxID=2650499 RepID=UPI001688FF37|nr:MULTISPECIES: hypothetical protein [unclassified Leptolyngbya]MBD1909069.1 hypothetical protein [Leptolyngbya sp. FACHB-8]MBD2157451.1 hypothetical protein [Leptolyngbya sp. FACHB-16]